MRARKDRTAAPPGEGRATAGQQLSAAMLEKELNQPALAELVGCSQVHISQLENDQTLPSPELAKRIEGALGLPAHVWLEESIVRNARAKTREWMDSGAV